MATLKRSEIPAEVLRMEMNGLPFLLKPVSALVCLYLLVGLIFFAPVVPSVDSDDLLERVLFWPRAALQRWKENRKKTPK